MAEGDSVFWWYGMALGLALGLAILIPFWRGRSDALTAWNLLLFGSIIHIAIGCLEVYSKKMHWDELKWFDPNSHEIRWFLVGTTLFFACLLLFHAKVRFPERLLQNRLSKWPDLSAGVVVLVLLICGGITAIMPFVANITFVREIALNLSHSALAVGVTFATVYWLNNRLSPFAFLLIAVAFSLAALEAMITFAGRRLLLTVAFGPVVAMYWMVWRYWSRTKLVAIFSVITTGLIVMSAFYATFRHMKEEKTAASVIARARSVTTEEIQAQLADIYHYLAQNTVHYSLLTMRLVDDGRLDVRPLDTLQCIIAYPIPRVLWPEKPRDLGLYIESETLRMPYKTNWGVGVTGQGYHDGGLLVLVLYAFLLSILVKVFDVPLARQPNNPFLLAMLASASAHFVALPRGGIAAMSLNILESIFMLLVLAYLCRALFGTSRTQLSAGGYAWPAQYYPNAARRSDE